MTPVIEFLIANWYYILIAIFALIFLQAIGSVLGIAWFVLKVLFFPFWLLYIILKPCFSAIRSARAAKKSAERRD